MKNWDDYRLLLAIHKGKTLRNAASELGVNHSTVSRRLATINKQFGAAIIYKTNSGLQLSPLGEQLLQSAQKIESLVVEDTRYERAQHLELEGCITVSVPPPILQFLLLDELLHFQQTHPRIKLTIDSSYAITNLDKCEADVVVRVSNTPDEHLVGYSLFSIATQYYAAKNYLNDTPSHMYQWITDSYSGDIPNWIANTPFPNAKIGPIITDLVLRHQAANAGHGMIRGACYIAHNFNNLTPITDAKPQPFQKVWVLSSPELKHIEPIQVLKKFLADALRAKQHLIVGDTCTADD